MTPVCTVVTPPAPVTFPALGTTAVVVVTRPASTAAAVDAVEREIAAVDAACSRFREDSELTTVNRAAGTGPVVVSPLLVDAVMVAIRVARATGGLVDPTVGRAMRVIGYDRTFSEVAADGPALQVRLARVAGWRHVDVDRVRSTVALPAGVSLDLGASAKAWCADRAARAAAAESGAGVLVSLGGDIAVCGEAPPGGWSVLVAEDHAAPVEGAGPRVGITSGGLATSGTTVRRWQRGTQTFHHVVDPATGGPAQDRWRTVSVAAASCVDANAAATAAIILGRRACAWLAERRLPARLVDIEGAVTVVGGWPADRVESA
jgi:FAD:protein FMN transferase